MGWHEKVTGFVPTMGALHEGHASSIRLAKSHPNWWSCPSSSTHPIQRQPGFRDLSSDAGGRHGQGPRQADAVFMPSAERLRREASSEPVHWGALTHAYEGTAISTAWWLWWIVVPDGASNPGGVWRKGLATGRGEKLQDRHPGLKVVVAPLVREPSGLAMSSRNARLSTQGVSSALAFTKRLRCNGVPRDQCRASPTRGWGQPP